MSKSYKLKNGYIDSTGIVHNKKLLSDILNSVKDFTSDDGYVRFENGLQIAWKTANVNAGGTAWNGTAVWYSDHAMGNWKVAFKNIFTAVSDVKGQQYWTNTYNVSNTNAGSIRCFRPNSTVNTVTISIIGIGTWK